MKVDYTVPSPVFFPKDVPVPSQRTESTFRNRLQHLTTRAPQRWKEVLRLDLPPGGVEWIEAPPCPEDLELGDAASLR
ncbi:MAG: hypothetical protein L0312_22405, partial [Acidobacteria bacterium]|nr:hypothetical protein [Acidobacteriota bacterium]